MPHIFYIPPSLNFLEQLAKGVLQRYAQSPESLAQLRVLLPTQRTCRMFEQILYTTAGTQSLMLPRVLALGDAVDAEDELLRLADSETLHSLSPAIGRAERRLLLTDLVYQHHKNTAQQTGVALNHEQALLLAKQLEDLLDGMQRYEVPYEKLDMLVPDEFAAHWQHTLSLLHIVTQQWPALLAQRYQCDPVARHTQLMNALCTHWRNMPPAHPIIIAGSTASVPATARLMQTVAQLPNGAVILPGLDVTASHSAPAHPHYNLQQFLKRCGTSQADVTLWSAADKEHNPRADFVSAVFAPDMKMQTHSPTHLRWYDAKDPHEEAQTIAILLREALENKHTRIALVTTDTSLPAYVNALMQRWNVTLDSSMGKPLSQVPAANYLLLITEMLRQHYAPHALLAVLKHPYSALGMARVECLEATRTLELGTLRGVVPDADKMEHSPLLRAVKTSTQSLYDALSSGELQPLHHLLRLLIRCAEALATSADEKGDARLWNGPDGAMLRDTLEEYIRAHPHFTVTPRLLPELLRSLLADRVYRPPLSAMHPHIHMLTPMEARLLSFDMVVMAGMNQGVWPQPQHNAWLSASMMEALGLPTPEHFTGLAAHDVSGLLCQPQVVITRAQRDHRTPMVSSPFWQRIRHAAGDAWNAMQLAPHYAQWRQALYQGSESNMQPAVDAACPPVSSRPTKFSATDIELLVRDPYGFYAKRILHLRALDEVEEEAGVKEIGIVLHAICEAFVREHRAHDEALEQAALHTLLQQHMRTLAHNPLYKHFWEPRMQRALATFLAYDRTTRGAGHTTLTELDGAMALTVDGVAYTITARADRIDITPDAVIITDYKTGTPPAEKDILSGHKAQLLIQGLIAQSGGYAGVPSDRPLTLQFGAMSGKPDVEFTEARFTKGNLQESLDYAQEQLITLLRHYANPSTPYLPTPDNLAFNDYAALERLFA